MTALFVDGNGLACRLWWANPAETAQRFTATVNMISSQHSAIVTACWDSPGPTWRREVMPDYKARRPPKPEALTEALEACRRTPFRHVSATGFEADDLIATLVWDLGLCEQALILSEDKDMAQLVGPDVRLVNMRGEITTEADVEKKWGVPPEKMRHLISWMGDSSDGLPGVRGVGPKKAIPRALAGEVGDRMTWELAGLAAVPASSMRVVGH